MISVMLAVSNVVMLSRMAQSSFKAVGSSVVNL